MVKLHQKDRGYAWVVCAASYLAHVLHCNLLYSRGMFYIIFRKNFNGESAAISLVPAINSAFTFGFAPVAGLLVSKFGARTIGILGAFSTGAGMMLASRSTELYHLYLAYGVLTGSGIVLIYNPCITILPVYFERQLALAAGIAVSGCGAGFVIFQYFIKYLDDEYGWRGTMLILGAIQLHCLFCAFIYEPVSTRKRSKLCKSCDMNKDSSENYITHEESNGAPSKPFLDKKDGGSPHICNGEPPFECKKELAISVRVENTHMDCSPMGIKKTIIQELALYIPVLKTPTYIFFSLGQLFNVTADSIIYTHLGAFAMSLNFSKGDAALLFTIIGTSNTVCRILSGMAAQRISPLLLCTVSALTLAVLTATLFLFKSLPLLVFYAVCFGGLCSPYHSTPVIVTSEVIQPQMFSRAMGLQVLLLAPGSLLGPLLAGVLFDQTGKYQASFCMASGLMVLSGTFALLPLLMRKLGYRDRPRTSLSTNIE